MAANVLVQQIYILSKLAICSQCSDHAEQWAGLWYFLAQISSVQQLQHLLLKQQQQLLWSAVAATAWHCCLCCAAVAISRARAVVDAITEVYCCFAVLAWDVVAKQLWLIKLYWAIAFLDAILLIHPMKTVCTSWFAVDFEDQFVKLLWEPQDGQQYPAKNLLPRLTWSSMYQPAAQTHSTVSTPTIQHATEIENFEAQLLKILSNSKIIIKENI